jgi:hypothetical protein
VNIPPPALEEWLTTAASDSVGTRPDGHRHSVGQLAGLRTLELLDAPGHDWSESDLAHARRTIGFVKRHRAQWPRGDVSGRRWRHALRNWGHDPLWADRLNLVGSAHGYELVLDEAPVGIVRLEVDGVAATLTSVEIAKSRRGVGLATAALHRVLHEELAPGTRIDAHAEGDARGLFTRVGFEVVSPDVVRFAVANPAG